jgi:hypothetical protein
LSNIGPISSDDSLDEDGSFAELICVKCQGVIARSTVKVKAGDVIDVKKVEKGPTFAGKLEVGAPIECSCGNKRIFAYRKVSK